MTEATIDRIQLATAPVQTSLPMTVGAIGARSSVIVQAELNSEFLRSGQRYELVMQGTYRYEKGAARKFEVHTFVVMPPPSEGSGELRTTQVPSQKVEGGRYPPRSNRSGLTPGPRPAEGWLPALLDVLRATAYRGIASSIKAQPVKTGAAELTGPRLPTPPVRRQRDHQDRRAAQASSAFAFQAFRNSTAR